MFGMRTGVASSLWPPERVSDLVKARAAPPSRERATECRRSGNRPVRAPRCPPSPGGLAAGKPCSQAERAISNG